PMNRVRLVRRIAARPAIVFAALTTPQGIAQWWGPDEGPVLIAETDVRVGGRFRVRFRMRDGSEHESRGEYLEVRSPELAGHELALAGRRGPERIAARVRPARGAGRYRTHPHPFSAGQRGDPPLT